MSIQNFSNRSVVMIVIFTLLAFSAAVFTIVQSVRVKDASVSIVTHRGIGYALEINAPQ